MHSRHHAADTVPTERLMEAAFGRTALRVLFDRAEASARSAARSGALAGEACLDVGRLFSELQLEVDHLQIGDATEAEFAAAARETAALLRRIGGAALGGAADLVDGLASPEVLGGALPRIAA